MPLDIVQAASQIEAMAGELKASQEASKERLRLGLALLRSPKIDARSLRAKIAASKTTWLPADPYEALDFSCPAPPPPTEFTIIATDGSHIDVDRHSPARCYLINLGSVLLQYGNNPHASLTNQPHLYCGEDLTITNPEASHQEQPVEGTLLATKRAVAECQRLAELAQGLTGDLPALALLDGSLVLWGLGGQDVPEFVKEAMLEHGLLSSLNLLKTASTQRRLAMASYISFPRYTDVVNALRIALCPYPQPDCDRCCQDRPTSSQRECEVLAGLRDRDLFQQSLSTGERSALFRNRSRIVRDRYRDHHIFFFYLKVGEEIARVELPQWVAENEESLRLLHSLVFNQCQRGHGYPTALIEAHEKAVLTGADREQFQHLVELALTRSDLSTQTSAKSQSKRTRWV